MCDSEIHIHCGTYRKCLGSATHSVLYASFIILEIQVSLCLLITFLDLIKFVRS